MFLRGYQTITAASSIGGKCVRTKVVSGSAADGLLSETKYFLTGNKWEVLDFGRVNIPYSSTLADSESTDSTKIIIQCSSDIDDPVLYFFDIVLMPTDEWIGCFTNTSMEDYTQFGRGLALDVDSIKNQKTALRGMLTAAGSDLISGQYMPDGGVATFKENEDQRLWFLAMNRYLMWDEDDSGVNNKVFFECTTATYLLDGIETGLIIVNETDGSSGIISSVEGTKIYATLFGGTGNDFDDNDVCHVITPTWVSYPETCHKVQAWTNPRYLSARGSR